MSREDARRAGPVRVVAFGGGHGLAASLRALRRGTPDLDLRITAVVTVGDDGGSSGRLRAERGALPPGDLRQALAALAGDDPLSARTADLLQHRFRPSGSTPGHTGRHSTGTGANSDTGASTDTCASTDTAVTGVSSVGVGAYDPDPLAGHAVGNLILCGLMELLGDPVAALDHLAGLIRARGRVLPMSCQAVGIEADVRGADPHRPREVVTVRGQHNVAVTPGRVESVRLTTVPPNTSAAPAHTGVSVAPTQPVASAAPAHAGSSPAPALTGTSAAPVHDGSSAAPVHAGSSVAPAHVGSSAAPARAVISAAPQACPQAVAAVTEADWLIFGPGSWYTSVIPHLLVPELAAAIVASPARRLVTLNLAAEKETVGLSLPDHLAALSWYLPGLRVDVVLADAKAVGDPEPVRLTAESLGARLVLAPVAVGDGTARHDPAALGAALVPLLGAARYAGTNDRHDAEPATR